MKALSYLKARLSEKGTWAAIVLAVSGGSALAAPYSWIAITAGVIGTLVPTP